MKNNKILTAAIIGCGGRGCNAYGDLMLKMPEKYKVVAMCDINPVTLKTQNTRFNVSENNLFVNPDEFLKEKRADLLVIATLDDSHIDIGVKALELGYDLLLEKPLSDKKEECERLLAAQKQYGGKIIVCHVLRYAPAFTTVKELIDEGKIGKLVTIQALEEVAYWHIAHSFVRGNWRNTDIGAPMILAKCCHDLDLLQYYAGAKCESLSSVGDLSFFKAENQPEGAADKCYDCKYIDTCPYSAKAIYYNAWKNGARNWPVDIALRNTDLEDETAVLTELKASPYSRCVFKCDNNVVDHQIVQMTFENGVKANLTMMGFTQRGGRIMQFFGTHGQILLDEERKVIEIKQFGKPDVVLNTEEIVLKSTSGYGHGGGDESMIRDLYDLITGDGKIETALEASIESHLMGIYAEQSRLEGGKLIYIHK